MFRGAIALLVTGSMFVLSAMGAYAQGVLAITHGTLIDATGAAPVKNATLLIRDGRIEAVGRASDIVVPDGAKVINARGKYVIPGLMDANVHLSLIYSTELLVRFEDHFPEVTLEAAQFTLKHGLTTVFDTYGHFEGLKSARDKINAGEAQGSRIFFGGNIIGLGGFYTDDWFGKDSGQDLSAAFRSRIDHAFDQGMGQHLLYAPEDVVRAAVREYARTGVDFLKYAASGHMSERFQSFSPDAQKAIVEEGHAAGLVVQAHVTNVQALNTALQAGLDFPTHCGLTGSEYGLTDDLIDRMVRDGQYCSVIPITQRRLDFMKGRFGETSDRFKTLSMMKSNQTRLIKAGVHLMVSTDSAPTDPITSAETPATPDPRSVLGIGTLNALVALEEEGMAPMELLKTATINVARGYHRDKNLGSLEPGKVADVVILDKDPLQSAQNYRALFMVIKDGKVVDLDALPTNPFLSTMKVKPAFKPTTTE